MTNQSFIHRQLPWVVAVLLLSAACRPPAPDDTRLLGGSVTSALEAFAETGRGESTGTGLRGFDEKYAHWADELSHDFPSTTNLVIDLPPQSPMFAGFIGIASVLGLRDLAALWLYIEADRAEHMGDFVLHELCMEAIPLVDPHFIDAYIIHAFMYARRDRNRARAILLRGAQWNPEDWELWYDLAWLELRPTEHHEPKPEAALPYLARAISVRHPVYVRRLFAMALHHLGHNADAKTVLEGMLDDPSLSEQDRTLAARHYGEIIAGYDRLADRLFSQETYVCPMTLHDHHHDCGPDCSHEHHHHDDTDHGS